MALEEENIRSYFEEVKKVVNHDNPAWNDYIQKIYRVSFTLPWLIVTGIQLPPAPERIHLADQDLAISILEPIQRKSIDFMTTIASIVRDIGVC